MNKVCYDMRALLYIINIVIVLLQTSHAIRQFDYEYPGVTVCDSSMSYTHEYEMPYSYMFLRKHFGGNHNCTHIEGNLIIHNVYSNPSEPDLSFLKMVREVTGMVSLRNNTLKKVILPNLKVIRGQESTKTKHGPVSLYLELINETVSGHAILPNLRVISNNSVFFESMKPQNFLPKSVKWEELFENPSTQKLFVGHATTKSYKCHPSCDSVNVSVNLQNHCWSSDPNHCQKKTKCTGGRQKSCQWCYFKINDNKIDENCCNSECSGGCLGNNGFQCEVCKNYIEGNTCVESCSPEYISVEGKKQKNPKFRLRVGMICAKSCPTNLLLQEDACIYKCSSPQFHRVDDRCIFCENQSDCKRKECILTSFMENKANSNFYMTQKILEKLGDCEHIIGEFHFTVDSFNKNKGNITIPMLYKYLKKVQFLTGDLMIDGSNISIHNLTFLENLKEIRHLQTHAATGSLNIFYTDLEFLGLRRLRHIYGSFEEMNNTKLCYLETLPWNQHILRNYLFNSIIRHCNKSCDSQCTNYGCWGSTSDMCYQCKGKRAGYNCVQECSEEPGFYTDTSVTERNYALYDDGSCKTCNILCALNCTGPLADDCIGACRYFAENGKCVRQCSANYYPENGLCKKCNSDCFRNSKEPLCTGKGSFMGQGGCKFCIRFIERNHSYFCFAAKHCPDNFYLDDNVQSKSVVTNHLYNLVSVCKPCLYPCKICSAPSLHSDHCTVCNGSWKGDMCVSECSPGIPTLSINGSCLNCIEKCQDGCIAEHNNIQCSKCKLMRFEFSVTEVVCVSKCPSGFTHTHYEEDSSEVLCLSKKQWNKRNPSIRFGTILVVLIVISVAITLTVSLILFVQYFYKTYRRKSLGYLKAIYSNIQEPDSSVQLFNKDTMPNMNRLLLIPTTDLIFDINSKPLGTGAFGAVYQGLWKPCLVPQRRKEYLDVAIKVIQANREIDINEILEEAKVMASVSHKHCLRLIGICLKYKVPCLVTTFVELGSLDKYIRKYKNTLSSYRLLSWGEQIANGMAYLEMRGIIHRDLATRNVLLNSEHIVQITDFGLSHMLQDKNKSEEIVITSGLVPIRWLALETLTDGIYSHKTDVWAYGITLWEIFTYGNRPYEKLDVREITQHLLFGYRLLKPEICSDDLYRMMNECWLEVSSRRPSFSDLMTYLKNCSYNSTFYLNIPNDSCLTDHICRKERLASQCSYEMHQYPKYKGIYKQHSLDRTISTIVGDYTDYISGSSLRRQSSVFSTHSNRTRFSGELGPFNRQQTIISENIEESDNFLDSGPLLDSDSQYLEPIKKK